MSDQLTGLKRLTGPAAEPITLDQAKSYLRVDHTDDDTLISAMIGAAREAIEEYTRRALITQTWGLTVPCIPADGQPLPRPPFQSVDSIRVFSGGSQSVITPSNHTDLYSEPVRFHLDAQPTTSIDTRKDAWEIRYVCGYGDAAADVPKAIHNALKLLLAHFYEHRTITPEIPDAVRFLLDPYQVFALATL